MIDKRILPLALGGLAIGTTEFVIMGLLPDVAGSMGITIPEAGHLIAAYALGVVVGAPTIIGFSSGLRPKLVLISLMIAFSVFNTLSAVATNQLFLLMTRFLSGLPHGAFFGIGGIVAAKLAKKGQEATYISLMYTGLTVANLAMVPFVTFVGHALNWRWAFAIVAAIGVITILALKIMLPAIEPTEKTSFKTELGFLRKQQSWYILGIVSIGFGGVFAWLSYISPLMTSVAGFDAAYMPYIMVLIGGGMVIGNILGAKLSDEIGAPKATTVLFTVLMLVLLAIFWAPANSVISLLLTFLCGMLSMSMIAPVNMIMMASAKKSQVMGAAFIQAAFNLANSLGAFLGGIPMVFGYSYNYASLVGMALTLVGLVISILHQRRYADLQWQKPAGHTVLH